MKNTFLKPSQKRSKDIRQSESRPDKIAKGLRDLFENELKDVLWAEKALIKAFPKMIKNAQSPDLINSISEHLDITIGQVSRLEKVFALISTRAVPKKCEAMYGLIRESEEIIENTEEGLVRDAGIISAARKIEHYEIASYGTLCVYAEALGEIEAVVLLKQTLDEEKEAERELTSIAKTSINLEASYEEMIYGYYGSEKRRTA